MAERVSPTDAQWHVGGELESRGMLSRTSEVLTEIQGANPTDEFVDVRRRKTHDASHLQDLGHLHDVEKSEHSLGTIYRMQNGCEANISIGGQDARGDCQ